MTRILGSLEPSSLLLWALAAVLAVLTAHVYLGWVRDAQRQPEFRASWMSLAAAALTMGTGLGSMFALSIVAAPLSFAPGYQLLLAVGLWLGTALAAGLPAWWLMKRQNLVSLLACALILAATAALQQVGWTVAMGLRPGPGWRWPLAGGAAAVQLVGAAVALWMAFGGGAARQERPLWRIGSGVVLGLCLMAGQQVMLTSARLGVQTTSVFADDLPVALVALVGGLLVPLVGAFMALDLELRRGLVQAGDGGAAAPRRRRRKHRIRTL